MEIIPDWVSDLLFMLYALLDISIVYPAVLFLRPKILWYAQNL